MKKQTNLIFFFIFCISLMLFADPPDWETLQGTQYSMVIMAKISLYGQDFVSSGDNMAAAFGPN